MGLPPGRASGPDGLRTGEGSRATRPVVDRCPGALVLHEAADGGLARIRLPGGFVDGETLLALGTLAESFGAHGTVELTSRANLQIRGVPPGCHGELADRVAALGLLPSATHERVRNIVASPFAGLLAGHGAPVDDLVTGLDRALCGEAELARLSGRFLFGLDGGAGDIAGLHPDAWAVALPDGRWWVGPAGVTVVRAAVVAELLATARAFLHAAGAEPATPPVWRLRDLPDGGTRLAVAARAGRPATARPVVVDPGPPITGSWRRPDGRQAAAVGVPLGRLTLAAAKVLAAGGPGALRVTPWRSVVVPTVAAPGAFADGARQAGLVTDPGSLWTRVTACAGRPGCARALADVRADAAHAVAAGLVTPGDLTDGEPTDGDSAAADLLEDGPLSSALASVGSASSRPVGTGRVHWSGCERRCGHPGGPHLEVVAGPTGYLVRMADVRMADVRAARVEPKETAGW